MPNMTKRGTAGFGSFRNETSNIRPGGLSIPQSVSKPKPAPMSKSGGKGPSMVKFGSAKVPKPAKNRAGFTTSD